MAASAQDLNHDGIRDMASDLYLEGKENLVEFCTCGFPKIENFDEDNFEIYEIDEFNEDEFDEETGELIVKEPHQVDFLIADCGFFEIDLYNYRSSAFPDFKHPYRTKPPALIFEESELYKAVKPFFKKVYTKTMTVKW